MTNKPCWEEKLLLFKKLEKESVHLLKRELVIVYQTINYRIYGLLSAAFSHIFHDDNGIKFKRRRGIKRKPYMQKMEAKAAINLGRLKDFLLPRPLYSNICLGAAI